MMKFMICLPHIIEREVGWPQPRDGGPWVRGKNGAVWDERRGVLVLLGGATRSLPTDPDGMAYDDHPDDTGGRTCMGVLQRVYDPYRRARGLPVQDVWRISDGEVNDIYLEQYWRPLKADRLPPGIDLSVFCMGVNAGIGAGAKLLQRIVGTAVDGQIGEATLGATADYGREHGLVKLIRDYADARERYYRQIPTFPTFGAGWLTRNRITTEASLAMVADRPDTWVPTVSAPTPTGPRATAPTADAAVSTVGNTAVAVGGTSGANAAVEVTKAARDVLTKPDPTFLDFLLAVASTPSFWISATTLAAAVYLWIQRENIGGVFR